MQNSKFDALLKNAAHSLRCQAIARKMAHGTIIWRDLGVMVKMNDVNYVHAHVCALACIHHFLVCIHAGISVFQKFTISSGIWHAEELF